MLMEADGGGRALILQIVWDDAPARDRFVEALGVASAAFPLPTEVRANEVMGRPGSVLSIGQLGGATLRVLASDAGG